MSVRKTILRELSRTHQIGGSGRFKRPDSIAGFASREMKFRAAVNQLLQDRLIQGVKSQDGHLVIALNDERLPDVHKELRPWWANPLFWALGTVLVGLTATGLIL